MDINSFLQKSKRQRRALARRASRDKKFYEEYRKLTFDLKVEVNKRLRQLKKSNLDYGSAYNNIMFFTHTMYNTERLLSPNELGNDLEDMLEQNEHALKFLKSGWSNQSKAREQEQHRVERLQELGKLPTSFKRRSSVEFLRWLGSEEVTAAIDVFGRSDIIVDLGYDIFKNEGHEGLNTLSIAIAEFLDNKRIGFDEAMRRRGINIEKYILKDSKNNSTTL